MRTAPWSAVAAAILLMSSPSAASDQPGTKAYEAGLAALKQKKDSDYGRLMIQAAKEGNTDAKYHVAFFYQNGGYGMPEDINQAMDLWEVAAANPDGRERADAMNALGMRYFGVFGAKRDPERAIMWYGRSATLGNAEAQFELGSIYGRSDNPQDRTLGVMLMRQAAVQRHRRAMTILGDWLVRGDITPKDVAGGRRWLTRAAKAGEQDALNALRKLDGLPPIYGPLDYRNGNAEKLRNLDENRLPASAFPKVSAEENAAYEKWFSQTWAPKPQFEKPTNPWVAQPDSWRERNTREHQARMNMFYSDWEKQANRSGW